MDKRFTVEKMKSALLAIRTKISDAQWSMLKAHYLNRTLSMQRIAIYGGYSEYRAGNSQYGAFCGRVARQLRFTTPGDQTYTIATVSHPDEKGHTQWRMDDVVVKALRDLQWFSHIAAEKLKQRESRLMFETEREALIKARVGQGLFRIDLIALWGSCAVTGCTLSKVLIASHIVPWALCKTNRERLDPFNGLLLTPNLDRLVDLFLISFNDDGSILVSKDLRVKERTILGISGKYRLRFVPPAMLSYLQRHRRLFLELQTRSLPRKSRG